MDEQGVGFQVDLVPHHRDPSQGDGNDVDWVYTHTESLFPIELITLNAESQGVNAILSWETASEINNSHFEI